MKDRRGDDLEEKACGILSGYKLKVKQTFGSWEYHSRWLWSIALASSRFCFDYLLPKKYIEESEALGGKIGHGRNVLVNF